MITHAKRLHLPAALVAACGIAACGRTAATATGAGTSAGSSHLITLKSIKFNPGTLSIQRGESVTWKWEDGDIFAQHNVTSTGSTHFKSSSTITVGTYTVAFTTAGTYAFECTVHPASMQGTIVVR